MYKRQVITQATVELDNIDTAQQRKAVSNASGQFSLAGLPPGRYKVSITAQGFDTSTREFTLQPRDRAVLSATLIVGSVTETVEVENGLSGDERELVMAAPGVGRGFGRGVEGGIRLDAAPRPMMQREMAVGGAFTATDMAVEKVPASAANSELVAAPADARCV